MSEIIVSRKIAQKSSKTRHSGLWIVLAAWFTVVFFLANARVFVASPGTPPLTLLIASTAPVIAFVLLAWVSPAVKELALSANVRVGTAMQAWRFGGFSFLLLYSYGYLPGYFAWPAAVGDIFVGATAPLMLRRLNDPDFVRSRTFVVWNIFGILDLVVAVGMGALGSLLVGSPAGVFPTTIMSQLPLVLIPTFFVPLFVVLHLVALLQAKQSRRS